MPIFSIVSKLCWENSQEKSERVSKKSIHNIHNITDSDYPSNHQRHMCKKSRDNIIVSRFRQGIDSMQRGKIEQILRANSLFKEIVTVIMMLFFSLCSGGCWNL